MYCQTCGSKIPEGRTRCEGCGAAVSRAPVAAPQQTSMSTAYAAAYPLAEPVSICPRCTFRGQSVTYFSRGTHVAGLVALTVLTAGFLGVGGLGYYLLRREHRICSRCGHSMGKHGSNALTVVDSSGQLAHAPPREASLAEEAGGPGAGAWILFALAALLGTIGIVEFEALLLMWAAFSAAGGFALMHRTRRKRETRRKMLIQTLQQPVLALAGERRGRLTVTEVASSMGWTLPRAEKVLNSLEDGLRVVSDVTDEGVIVYEFRELTRASGRRADTLDAFFTGADAAGERQLEA
jgi:hypothetical protein